MNCIIPSGSIRVFKDIIHCMASFGTEVILTCFSDQLVLSIGDNIDAYICQFSLDSKFFQLYEVNLNSSFSSEIDEVSCRMNLESLEQIFQGIGADEKLYDGLQIKLEMPNPNASALIEDITIYFELKFSNGLSKINKLTYFDGSHIPLIRSDPSKWKNHVALPAKIMLDWMKKFHTKGQDLWMIFGEDSLSLKTRDSSLSTVGPGNLKLNTEFSLGVEDFVTYQVEPDSSLSFSAKDIKTLSRFAQSIKSDLEIYFNEVGSPINFEVKFSSIVAGKLYVPALNNYNEDGNTTYHDPNIVYNYGNDLERSSISEISLQSNFNSTRTQPLKSITELSDNNLPSPPFAEGSFRLQESPIESKYDNQPQFNTHSQETDASDHQVNKLKKSTKRPRDTPPSTKSLTTSERQTDSSQNTSQHGDRSTNQVIQKVDFDSSGLSIEASDISTQINSSLPNFSNMVRNERSSTQTDPNSNTSSAPVQRNINVIQKSSNSQTLEAKNSNENNINTVFNSLQLDSNSDTSLTPAQRQINVIQTSSDSQNLEERNSDGNNMVSNNLEAGSPSSIEDQEDGVAKECDYDSDFEVPDTPPAKVFRLFDDED